nr:ionotropic receptor [Odontothrips loti]
MKVFWGAVWFSIALFLKQSVRGPEDSHRVRLLTILLSFAATYVIGDMYSANLTSMLARPGRERPISNLEQLADAMETRGYQLLVEKHSSSYNILENGTGVYERLWRLMQRQRLQAEVESGEDGMQRVGSEPNLAMLGGRETLYFDTRRFGANRFHLSEKLFTRYSAIALQIGCPYIESINNMCVPRRVGSCMVIATMIRVRVSTAFQPDAALRGGHPYQDDRGGVREAGRQAARRGPRVARTDALEERRRR